MKVRALLAIPLISCGFCLDAVAAPFVGFNAGLSLSGASNTLQVNNWTNNVFGPGNSGTLNGSAGNQFLATVNGGYTFSLGEPFLLGVGASIDLVKSKLLSDPNGAFLASPYDDIKQHNHYAIYAKPGYLIAPNTEAYVKLAYHSMSVEDPNSIAAVTSQRYSGFGYGAGLRTVIADRWSAFVEVEQIAYQSRSDSAVNGGNAPTASVKPSSTLGTVGLEYTF